MDKSLNREHKLSQHASQPTSNYLDPKKFGIAYTPRVLAQYVADKTLEFFIKDYVASAVSSAPPAWRILDPACGEGELLVAAWRSLMKKSELKGVRQSLQASNILCAIDLDQRAVAHTAERIARLNTDPSVVPRTLVANSLCPDLNESFISDWKDIAAHFDASNGFDVVIANPPWGADVSSYRSKLFKNEYSLLKGQFDSSDLFLELSLKILKSGGFLSFIVSDSLFNAERAQLRGMLLQHTQILLVARLGEKIFPNINRACSIVICQKKPPDPSLPIECLRLTPEARRQILEGSLSFHGAEKKLTHFVPQSRFMENRDFSFDIDVQAKEEITISKLKKLPHTFADYVSSSRGVELSKNGQVCRCPKCHCYTPKPATTRWLCRHCGAESETSLIATIVSEQKTKGYVPLLVGESIRRYSITTPMYIKSDCDGIKYKKPELYIGPKILVRKTGVGISAALDYSGALTNQVVYIFRALSSCKLPIETFLMVLNSRAMYYFVAKQHGETEWRSHPYITQSQILNLPLPDLTSISAETQRDLILTSGMLRKRLITGAAVTTSLDARIERLVAKLLNLSATDYKVIYRALASCEDLLPVRALSFVAISDVFNN